MYIHGYYYNEQNDKIAVYIQTQGDRSEELVIGGREGAEEADIELCFSDDPVEMQSQVNDTFDVLLCQQASIRLQARNYRSEFFCNSCREAVVNIYRNSTCIFAGYIEPQAFSQPYNEVKDEVELTCIDCLSALQYSNYRNVGATGVTYAKVKAEARQRTFRELLGEMLRGVTQGCDLLSGRALKTYYDGSKAMDQTEAERYKILEDISISELLFLGDEEDDVWTQEEVTTEVLKYLNLHIMQDGLNLYIFSWESLRRGKAIEWRELSTDQPLTSQAKTINVRTEIVADCDTQISLSETYNQLLLIDSVKEVENIVDSPLDDDSIITQGNYQKYMTEYISEGEGKKAYNAMKAMTTGGSTGYEGASQVDWFCWPKSVVNWQFYGQGSHKDIYAQYPADGSHQQDLLSKGMVSGIGACVCALGKIERKNGGSDNSPVTSVTMDNYLIISLCGHDSGAATQPTADDVLKACPVAEYTGNRSGGTFSPADEQTTNYIVITGKMVLNPSMKPTGTWENMKQAAQWDTNRWWHQTVPSRNNSDGRYYCRRYWKSDRWNQEVTDDEEMNAEYSEVFYPYTGTGPQDYEYNYSANNTAKDTIKKLGLLQCMLIIGDKCVVEKQKGEVLGDDEIPGTGEGEPQDYVWMPYKERSACASDDEYYQQSFTIGVDPKLKDKILGTEFDIQKNAPYTMGITAEGTAIPIKMSDKVSGQVKFLILGPVNAEWNQITRRHPSFWRHTKWSSESVALLTKANSLMIKEFKVEVISDNGKIGAVSDEKDITYMSDTKETFVNRKDDLEMKITTALTSEECKKLGVNNAVKLSSPENELTRNALLSIYDHGTGEAAKPEQLYVDAYWREWHEPRVLMVQNLMDSRQAAEGYVSPWSLYRHPALGKTFHVQGISRNLTEGTAQVTLKEIF